MAKKLISTTTLLDYDDGSSDVRYNDDIENDEGTFPEQSGNSPGTVREQSENDTPTIPGTKEIIPSQTANAVKMRVAKLLNNGRIPKQMIYPAVWKALEDNKFVREATNSTYKSYVDFLDYPPQAVADALNREGLTRPDGKPWNDKNLAPLVAEMKEKRRFSPITVWAMNIFWLSVLIFALSHAAQAPSTLEVYEGEVFNIDSAINRYQEMFSCELSGWRIGQIRDTGQLSSYDNAIEYFDEQMRLQNESIKNANK